MCGILGSVNVDFSENELGVLYHRGPDDSGLKQFNIDGNRLTFGHRRLSIVDLSAAGHQPMTSKDGRFTIIFNGEIYNHQELRSKLGNIHFAGHSDTETIVNYLAAFGVGAVKDFNGIFAFALFDVYNNELLLFRDRYGVKPLYYWLERDQLIFSSEIKAIRQLTDRLSFSMESLALMLKLRYCPAPYTLYKEIMKMRPGHILKMKLLTKELSHETFIEPVSKNNKITFREALEAYDYHFENAVKSQLMSDVDLGILLSGGVDSALVSKLATKHYSGKLKTFTVGFSEKTEANELSEAKKMAETIGSEHYEVIIDNITFEESFSKMMEVIEEPLGTTSTIPFYYLNEVVKKHVKVVLTGQGADEPLGGYARYKGELIYHPILQPIAKSVRDWTGEIGIRNEKVRRAIHAFSEKNIIKRFDNTYALFLDEEIMRMIGVKTNISVEAIEYFYTLLKGNEKHPVEAMMSNDIRMNLADDLLLLSDKISMNFSIEARVPLLDNHLVDFVESLPYQYRVSLKGEKIIHKKFAEKYLPKEVVYQRKKGFNTPAEKWFREKGGIEYRDRIVSDTGSLMSIYFDMDEVRKIFDQHLSGRINREKQIFALISIYHWLSKFMDD